VSQLYEKLNNLSTTNPFSTTTDAVYVIEATATASAIVAGFPEQKEEETIFGDLFGR
jgi:hypothetical protein